MGHSHNSTSFDLAGIAYRTMLDHGFKPEFPPEVLEEVKHLKSQRQTTNSTSARDLRSLLWSSIDDSHSRDLDQVEYAEKLPNGDVRVLVGIADVDALVPKGSATDNHAADNATSVYTGVEIFPMLPEELSTDMTSLVGGSDRTAIVTEMTLASDGTVKMSDIYPALIHNYAKLSYQAVGDWLDNNAVLPPEAANVPGMESQLRTQLEAAKHLLEFRRQHGALELDTPQATPVVGDSGHIAALETVEHNSARLIIENFMVAANVAMAGFLEAKHVTSLRRVVKAPEQWPRIVELAKDYGENLPADPDSRALSAFMLRRKQMDPEHFPDISLSVVKLLGPGEYDVEKPGENGGGHFGLAVNDYTHSTAPNRRYADLVTQRLVKAVIAGSQSPYSDDELEQIASHCTERDEAERKVERKMRKVIAAVVLRDQIGQEFDGIVTGVTPKGTFARLLKPIADGLITKGEEGLRVGDKVRVRLLATDPSRGYIDFANVSHR